MAASPFCGNELDEAAVAQGYCVHSVPISFQKPRSIIAVGTSGFLVLERGTQSVVYAFDSNGDGVADSRSTVVVAGPDETSPRGANHGLAYHDGWLYASSDTTVWRWLYNLGDLTVSGSAQVVIVNMNADGMGGAPAGHTTRTLEIYDGYLYVSIGSAGNVDENSYRSRIRRFPVPASNATSLPLDFQLGEVFADGLRNEVGLAFDRHGVLWGVENGADNLWREDLGGNINEDNPAEELNRFPEELVGANWGYPECFTEFSLRTGLGRGTVWTWPTFLDVFPDDQCRSERIPPELAMQGHSAPLGIVFYNYTENRPPGCVGGFPEEMDGFAFLAFHGSWNRKIPTGYKVVYVAMTPDGRVNTTDLSQQPADLLRHGGKTASWTNGYRPVDVDFDACGRLLLTSDGSRGGRGSGVSRISFYDGNEGSCCGQNTNQGFPPSCASRSTSVAPVLLMMVVLFWRGFARPW